jgi:hypothetical protein
MLPDYNAIMGADVAFCVVCHAQGALGEPVRKLGGGAFGDVHEHRVAVKTVRPISFCRNPSHNIAWLHAGAHPA